MKTVSSVFVYLRLFLSFCLALGACKGAQIERTPQAGVATLAPTHLDMYLADTSMPLDRSVLVELANDSLLLQGVRQQLITSRLAQNGFVVGSLYAKRVFAAFRSGDPSPISGDGQALIVADGNTLSYGPHVELTVPDNLYDLEESDFPIGQLRWVASVVNLDDQPYTPLQIDAKSGVCLFVGRDNTWNVSAYLVVPNVSLGCMNTGLLTAAQLQAMGAKQLTGYALDPSSIDAEFDEDDLPAAARWEWSASKTQVIGVRCATRWCQVAPAGTPATEMEPTPANNGKPTKEERRNGRFKGWYDLQVLADKNAQGQLVPSGVIGRFHPNKKSRMQMSSKNTWYFVGEIILLQMNSGAVVPAKYTNMGLALGTNQLKMCRGSYADCLGTGSPPAPCAATSEPVWGQIVSQIGTAGNLFPVCALADATYNTAIWSTRWAWHPNDEGMWVRCLNGCCQPKF